jgi:ABC-type transport system involved in multi-copper enzyme maturation permease subunit
MWVLWSAQYSEQLEVATGDINKIAKDLQRFAESFSLTFFLVQLTLVLLLTPIFVAGSVFEERDTRSGEVLLTTDLTRREVFYGKFLARVVQVMMVVAAGMPVLALTLLWGGVAIEFIIVGYAATFVCIWSSGAIAASVAGSSETFREAVLKAYAYILVFNALIFPASPYLLIPLAREGFGALCVGVIFFPVHLIVTVVSLAHGLRWLRLAMLRQRRRVTTELAQQMARRKPPVADEDPLVWKERYVGGESEGVMTAVVTTSLVIVLGIMILVLLGSGVFPAGWVTAYATPAVVLTAAAAIGLGAAGGVARERQKNTLTDLFMIPGGRREILRAKLLGAVWRGRWFLGAVGGLLVIGVLSGTPLVAVMPLALAAATYVTFGAALGVWLSVRCRTALTANAAWVGFVALSLIGTYLLADALSQRVPAPNGPMVTVFPDWSRVVNPVMAWQELAMTPDDPPGGDYGFRKSGQSPLRLSPDRAPNLVGPLAGVLLYGAGAGLLWFLAVRRFEREGREE